MPLSDKTERLSMGTSAPTAVTRGWMDWDALLPAMSKYLITAGAYRAPLHAGAYEDL